LNKDAGAMQGPGLCGRFARPLPQIGGRRPKCC